MIGSPEGVHKVIILYIPVRFTKSVRNLCFMYFWGTHDCKVARPIFIFILNSPRGGMLCLEIIFYIYITVSRDLTLRPLPVKSPRSTLACRLPNLSDRVSACVGSQELFNTLATSLLSVSCFFIYKNITMATRTKKHARKAASTSATPKP